MLPWFNFEVLILKPRWVSGDRLFRSGAERSRPRPRLRRVLHDYFVWAATTTMPDYDHSAEKRRTVCISWRGRVENPQNGQVPSDDSAFPVTALIPYAAVTTMPNRRRPNPCGFGSCKGGSWVYLHVTRPCLSARGVLTWSRQEKLRIHPLPRPAPHSFVPK